MTTETRTITEEQVVAVRQRWMCPEEGCSGEMEATGVSWGTYPAAHEHRCSECMHSAATTGGTYPRIVYRADDA